MAAVDLGTFAIKGLDDFIRLRRRLPHLADSLSMEQEIVGIDVASLYKAAGLSGTSAGVRLVYESALVVHKVAQIPTSASKPLAKVLGGDLKNLHATVSLTPKIEPRI